MNQQFSDKQVNRLVFTLLALFPLVGMGIDLLAPSLPAISANLHTSHSFSKNLITLYLIGYALGNLCIGFLSDAWGRRKLILIGLCGFIAASLLAPLIPQASALLAARFLQGLCIAVLAVLTRGIISDIVAPEKIVRTGAAMATMWGIGPIIGPFIGGYLQTYFGWQACFYFFALAGFVGLSILFFMLPETLLMRQPLRLTQIKQNFMIIISHKIFLGIVIIMGAEYSLLIAFNTLGPFVVQTVLGHSPIDFGHIALLMGVAFLVATVISRQLLKKHTPEKLFQIVIPIGFTIALLMLALSYWAQLSLTVLFIATSSLFFFCGLVYPAGIGKIMSLFRPIAGSAAAMMNLIINGFFTGMTALILSFINVTSIVPIIWSYLVLVTFCLLANWFFITVRK